jgi:hypothetical protein
VAQRDDVEEGGGDGGGGGGGAGSRRRRGAAAGGERGGVAHGRSEPGCRAGEEGDTAMQKLRIVILGFGTARQKVVLER